jgi:hypothetical protein
MAADPLITAAQQWLAFWDPRQLRQRWLAELTRVTERTMQSRAFLEMVRFTLAAMTRSAGLVFPFSRR